MARIAPTIWTDTPAGGTGVQMSKVYPAPDLRWLVWYGGEIVRFCDSVDQAFAWYMMIQSSGLGIIDTAGLGGTSWARIEARRASDVEIGELFAEWGVPTPESIRELHAIPGVTVIGSGGVRNGIEVAKAIALGADLVGLAQPFLAAANESSDRAIEKARRTIRELKIAMFCAGARTLDELRKVELRRRSRG